LLLASGYKTKSGEYFLHGKGSELSRYGTWRGNNGNTGEKIIPLSRADAEEWARKNMPRDGCGV